MPVPLKNGAADWVVEDCFNQCLKETETGFDVDVLHNIMTGDKLTTSPPTDPDMVKFMLPDWLAQDKEKIVKELWGDQAG